MRTGQDLGYEGEDFPEDSGGIATNGYRKARVGKTLDVDNDSRGIKVMCGFCIWEMF